jgi:SAM-dependent methyltransferase
MSFALFVSALEAELPGARVAAKGVGLSAAGAWNVLVVAQLRQTLRELAVARGRDPGALEEGRLFRGVPGFVADGKNAARERLLHELTPELAPLGGLHEKPLEAFGQLYELLLALRPSDDERNLRKRTGSYYTPEALTALVVARALDALGLDSASAPVRLLDPACGAGAFLVQAGRQLAQRSGRALAHVVAEELFGVDISPLAVAVAEASLWLLADDASLTLSSAGAHLREGDALCSPVEARALRRTGVDFQELGGRGGFDCVLGNPPWVAFAGRATQPLPPALRAHYRRAFQAFRGYPTLHALFVELAARLAPRGVVALLVPSPLADLDGYRPVRRALAQSHAVAEPLLELGQDAFSSVTQPCFALVATPRVTPAVEPERSWVLTERKHAGATAAAVCTPTALEPLARLPRLPPELFGEMGLQTNSAVTRQLLYRGTSPPDAYSYALLEGRNVSEFEISAPRLFLRPDRDVLAAERCRLRAASDYQRVKIVVRQTAAITIAARHDGTPFRNSLLAGFELPEFPFELVLGLLNSTLYRALHLASRRDARQGAFPQVKVAHLRALPAPPVAGSAWQHIAALSMEASAGGLSVELRRQLDAVVFDLFEIQPSHRAELRQFVRELSPRAGLTADFCA